MTSASIMRFIVLVLAFGVAWYAAGIALVAEGRPPFVAALIERWPLGALAHFACGSLALAAGSLQFSTRLRSSVPAVHRWLGRVYVVSVLASGAAALALAVSSSAGLWAQWGFGLLGIAWLITTATAYFQIRQGRVAAHRAWMIRSYALTFAAVTLRLYLPFAQVMEWPMGIAYPAIAWLCWVPNLIVAEWIVRLPPRMRERVTVGSPA